MSKIIVCGGRRFGEFSYKEKVNGVWVEVQRDKNLAIDERKTFATAMMIYSPSYIVQGAAKGADRMAILWANKYGVEHSNQQYQANWDLHGLNAGPERNTLMLDDNPDIDFVVAFKGGKGTANMIEQSIGRGLRVFQPKIHTRIG